MQKIAYLEIIYAFEILHASPHDPDFVGHHLTIFVKNAHHVWLLDEPKWVLEGTTSLGKKTALRSNYRPYFETLEGYNENLILVKNTTISEKSTVLVQSD